MKVGLRAVLNSLLVKPHVGYILVTYDRRKGSNELFLFEYLKVLKK